MAETNSRRRFLRSAGMLAAGATLGAGGTYLALRDPTRPPGLRLPRVKVSADRVIRTVVGLRPFRTSGFRVERVILGPKTLVHNYGHGGSGITLSWGSAHLAIDLLASQRGLPERVAVLGAGALGLATARLLQRRGVEVVIYAKALPPRTTSNVAAGQWAPHLVADTASEAFEDQFQRAVRFSHSYFQELNGARFGIRWLANYNLDNVGVAPQLKDLFPETKTLKPGEHPFPADRVARFTTMLVETPVYLDAMLRDVRLAGGRIVVRDFKTTNEVATLPESAIVNCTGLGSAALFEDDAMVPVRGQMSVLLPQPEIDYIASFGGLYMMPRRDGILLGGSYERGTSTLIPDAEISARILEGHAKMFGAMKV